MLVVTQYGIQSQHDAASKIACLYTTEMIAAHIAAHTFYLNMYKRLNVGGELP